jgi:hypothetical protein
MKASTLARKGISPETVNLISRLVDLIPSELLISRKKQQFVYVTNIPVITMEYR